MRKELTHFLFRLVPGRIALASGCSILAGASTVALFAFVFSLVRRETPTDFRAVASFAALAAASIVSRLLATIAIATVGNVALVKLRRTLVSAILKTRYSQLERIGLTRLKAVLTADVQAIAAAAPVLVSAATNITIVASLLIYMFYLSSTGALIIVVAAIISVPAYWRTVERSTKLSYEARTAWERLAIVLDGLIVGLKQLKLNTARAVDYLSEDAAAAENEFLRFRTNAAWAGALAMNLGQGLFLSVLGGLLFVHSSGARRVEFFFACIYLIGPLDAGIGSIASLANVNAVFRRIQDLGVALSSPSYVEQANGRNGESEMEWQEINFNRVCYSYDEADPTGAFAFGPVDLVLRRGEIVFVKGGNGSGKSTFAKILAGLYEPSSGSILIDHRPIDSRNRQDYRELFSCIFDEAHIFERVRGGDHSQRDAEALLNDWAIANKVMMRHSRFSNTSGLSRGQKGRLLLISALMEDRDICIFDEWAADQDSRSRAKFYHSELPRLKGLGKLVVVLTHDEEFDEVPDQIIRFHDGKIATDVSETIGNGAQSRASIS